MSVRECEPTLTQQELLFIDLYTTNGWNACQAAEDAGYSRNYSAVLVRKYLVREEIERRNTARRTQVKLTVAHVEGLIRDAAEVDLLDIWDENRKVKRLEDMSPSTRRAIKSIRVNITENMLTGLMEEKLEVELWNALDARRMLGQYKKMFTDKIEHSGEVNRKITMTINGIIK